MRWGASAPVFAIFSPARFEVKALNPHPIGFFMILDCAGKTLRQVSFEIKNKAGERTELRSAERLDGLCAGMKKGNLLIRGNAGDYLGGLNAGARVLVEGSAGRFAGDCMSAGEIVINGNSGFGTGSYMTGGSLLVKGSAGDNAGQMQKGGLAFIFGNAGARTGLYMMGGTIIIAGDAGERTGDFMTRGEIYVRGTVKSLGTNAKEDVLTAKDEDFLNSIFRRCGLGENPAKYKKIVPEKLRLFYG